MWYCPKYYNPVLFQGKVSLGDKLTRYTGQLEIYSVIVNSYLLGHMLSWQDAILKHLKYLVIIVVSYTVYNLHDASSLTPITCPVPRNNIYQLPSRVW